MSTGGHPGLVFRSLFLGFDKGNKAIFQVDKEDFSDASEYLESNQEYVIHARPADNGGAAGGSKASSAG